MRNIFIIFLFLFSTVSGQYVVRMSGGDNHTTSASAQEVIDSISGLGTGDQRVIDEVIKYWTDVGVWSKLDGLWVLADGVYINWKAPSTFQATITDTTHRMPWNGLKSNERSGYVNLNYNPSSDGVNFTQNSGSFGFYVLHGYVGGSHRILGGNDGTNYIDVSPQSTMYLRFNGNVNQYNNTAHTNPVLGLWSYNRTTSSNVEWYIDGTKKADITLATTGLPNVDMYALAVNDNGSPALYAKNIIGMVYFAGNLTASEIASLGTGYERIQSHYKRLNSTGSTDIIEHTEGHIPYTTSAYRSGAYVYQVWFQSTNRGDSTRAAMIRRIHDGGTISNSYRVGGSDKGNTDEHTAPYLTIDNNGYIYVSKEAGPNHISAIQVFKSDSPLSISGGFTRIDSLEGSFSYSVMLKAGSNIIMAARSSSTNVKVWKKGLTDASFTEVGDLCAYGDGRNYPYAIKNVTEDTVWLTVQINTNVSDQANFRKIFVLKSGDGETWYNVDNSFSKDITSAALTKTELDNNCLLISREFPRVVFSSGGFVEDGTPRLLVEKADTTTFGWRITDTLSTFHYSSGWQETDVRTGLTLRSRHDSYMHNASYMTYNDSEYIIFSYQEADSTVLEKWASADFSSWAKDSDWLDGTGLKFAWPSNDVQNTKTVGKNILFTGRFDPGQPVNIDTYVIENLKRF